VTPWSQRNHGRRGTPLAARCRRQRCRRGTPPSGDAAGGNATVGNAAVGNAGGRSALAGTRLRTDVALAQVNVKAQRGRRRGRQRPRLRVHDHVNAYERTQGPPRHRVGGAAAMIAGEAMVAVFAAIFLPAIA
jgi:hypothetical protein